MSAGEGASGPGRGAGGFADPPERRCPIHHRGSSTRSGRSPGSPRPTTTETSSGACSSPATKSTGRRSGRSAVVGSSSCRATSDTGISRHSLRRVRGTPRSRPAGGATCVTPSEDPPRRPAGPSWAGSPSSTGSRCRPRPGEPQAGGGGPRHEAAPGPPRTVQGGRCGPPGSRPAVGRRNADGTGGAGSAGEVPLHGTQRDRVREVSDVGLAGHEVVGGAAQLRAGVGDDHTVAG